MLEFDHFCEGQVWVMSPRDRRDRKLEIRVDDCELERLDELCFDLNLSRSEVVREAIDAYYMYHGGRIDD